jgi:biopolymer transport protein ExbD
MERFLKRHRRAEGNGHGAPEIDLVPLIDCVFLMLLFFMLCGSISVDLRREQITVPPATTASHITNQQWKREIINLSAAVPGPAVIRVGARHFAAAPGRADGYPGLRTLLDQVYAQSDKFTGNDRRLLPMTVVELRADGDCDMRMVAEVMQVVADAVDPATMQGHHGGQGFQRVEFTVRPVQ